MPDFQKVVDFIREMYQQPEGFIPLHAPIFSGNEKKYVLECIDSTFVSSVGKFVDEFEQTTANYVGAEYAVATVNGTTALQIALILVGVKPNDEVITQPLTFAATCNAIKHANAEPVFIDVDRDTMGMSPESLSLWLTNNTVLKNNTQTHAQECINKHSGRRIAAIVPMHTFGHPCRIDELVEVANLYGIPVVEDAAESLGSFYKGRHTGTFGKVGVFSYNGNKTITTGGGGMIVTNDKAIALRGKHLTTTAKIPHAYKFEHDEIGYNFRLPNINAALGVAQMEKIDELVTAKRKLAHRYKDFFLNTQIPFFQEPEHSRSNFWLNTILLEDTKEQESFLEFTNSKLIMTRPAWTLMTNLKMFKQSQKGELSNAEWLANRIVNIPSGLSEKWTN